MAIPFPAGRGSGGEVSVPEKAREKEGEEPARHKQVG